MSVEFLQSSLGILLISLSASTIGGFISYLLQRKSQHKTWLLENRIKIFIDFLKTFDECRASATSSTRNSTNLSLTNDGFYIDVFKAYDPLWGNMKIVRLLLEKKYSEKFEELLTKFVNLHASPLHNETNRDRYKTLAAINTEIQKIMEDHLRK